MNGSFHTSFFYLYNFSYRMCFLGYGFLKKIALKAADIQKEGQCYVTHVPGILFSRFRGLEYRRLIWLDNADSQKIRICRHESDYESFPPKFLFNQIQNTRQISLPPVWLYKFENAQVTANSTHIVTEKSAYIERVPKFTSAVANYSTGHIFDHSDHYAIIRTTTLHYEIESAVFLAGNGSENYYHWLVEILPKLQFFLEEEIFKSFTKTILVSSNAKDIPTFHTFLNQAIRDFGLQVIYMDKNRSYKVKTLYHLSAPSNIVFNTRDQISSPSQNYFRKESLDYIKELGFSLNMNSNKEFEGPKKIFLARKGSVRSYNQKEVFKILKEFGFVEIYMETLSARDQVRLFQNAEYIIGPTGAAWTNLIFCQNQPKCLCWMAEQTGDFSAFSNLAKYSGADLSYITYKAKSPNVYRSNYILEENLLLRALNELLREEK